MLSNDPKLITYFAYGSCMGTADFRRTVPEFTRIGRALLPDYRVAFTKHATSRNGGVADIIPAPGHLMEGVLFQFPETHLPALDQREGVHTNMYRRIQIELLHEGQALTAYTYEVVDKAEEEIAPSTLYRDLLLAGGDVLSPEYMDKLRDHMDDLRQEQNKTD